MQIIKLVGPNYEHVWDCCCDHGYLGQALLEEHGARIHFVDVQPHIIEQLGARLSRAAPAGSAWQTHCTDVHHLALAHSDKQLVVIAGVGGDTCVTLIQSLIGRHSNTALEFIVCPIRQIEHLRAELAPSCFLKSEHLVHERGRFYEVLHLSTEAGDKLARTATQFWDFSNPAHRRYVDQRITLLTKPVHHLLSTSIEARQAYHTLIQRFSSGSEHK